MSLHFCRRSIKISVLASFFLVILSTCEKPVRVLKFDTIEVSPADISFTTATLKGQITDLGSAEVEQHGIIVSESSVPSLGQQTTIEKTLGKATTKGYFSADFTDLKVNFTYYFRAFAVVAGEPHLGSIKQFKTKDYAFPSVSNATIWAISRTQARFSGDVLSDGGDNTAIKGLCWSNTANPTIENCIDTTVNGTGTGEFSGWMEGLVSGERYYVRVYSKNLLGTSYSNIDTEFKTHDLPEVTTAFVTGITTDGAISGGEVTDDGEVEVTARGVCWSTTPGPTVDLVTKTTDGTGKGIFVSNISGLSPGVTYYVRAYAINQYGVSYGSEVSFKTGVLLPEVTTAAVTSNTQTTAVCGGEVTTDGGDPVISRGVCYGTAQNPDITGLKTIDGAGTGQFVSSISGLTAGTKYYYRAYATNNSGTAYGEEKTFLTSWLQVTGAGGHIYNIIPVGTQEWIEINLLTNVYDNNESIPVVSDNAAWSSLTTGAYCAYNNDESVLGQTYGMLYNWYAVADVRNICPSGWHVPTDNDWNTLISYLGGTGIAGSKLKEVGTANWNLPNSDATNETHFSARGGGDRLPDGTFANLRRYGDWWSSSVVDDINGRNFGMYNDNGTVDNSPNNKNYGFSVRCTRGSSPLVRTNSATAVISGSATVNGLVNPNTATTTVTFEYGTSSSYGSTVTAVQSPASGKLPVAVSATISGLAPSTTYHYRVKAVNAGGTIYGEDAAFTTPSTGVPAVTTASITAITSSSASSGGSITSDGGSAISAKGICWSTSANPTLADQKTTDGTGTASFTSSITGLAPGTIYHVRAYATNSSGTGYGADLSFTTAAVLPTVTTSAISSVTNISASAGGDVTNNGGAAIIIKGVCWSTTSNPTTSDPKSNDGTGTGPFTSSITGLSPGTIYYVRAYATNSAGTAYGSEISFTTINPATTVFSIIGSETSWSSDIDIPYISTSLYTSTYRLSGRLFKQSELFKIRKNHDWITSYSWGDLSLAGEVSNFRNSSTNFEVISERTYEVLLQSDWSTGAITLTMNNITPALTTTTASSVSFLTASSGGNVTSQGSSSVTVKGVCWGTSSLPTTAGLKTTDGSGTGVFTSSLAGLTPGTTYFVRAYATNSEGTSYGNTVSFTTPNQVADQEGNLYNVVLIGNQLWMKENLAYLPSVSPSSLGSNTQAYYYVYDYQDTSVIGAKATANYQTYGVLYNWQAALTACPAGWHLPTDSDWKSLEIFLGMPAGTADLSGLRGTNEGDKIKSTVDWYNSGDGTDLHGFEALPAGYRQWTDGTFMLKNQYSFFWSGTDAGGDLAWSRYLIYNDDRIGRGDDNKGRGFSVRCILD